MKDSKDDSTVDFIAPRAGVRGRPVTGTALTAAERQKAYRDRKKAVGMQEVVLMLDAEVLEALRNFTKYKDETLGEAASRILRDRLLRKR